MPFNGILMLFMNIQCIQNVNNAHKKLHALGVERSCEIFNADLKLI